MCFIAECSYVIIKENIANRFHESSMKDSSSINQKEIKYRFIYTNFKIKNISDAEHKLIVQIISIFL